MSFPVLGQNMQFMDAEGKNPVSFATVAFGNGWGSHADSEGKFQFSQKSYPDVDTLYISALGYKDITIAVSEIKELYFLEQEIDRLDEIIIKALPKGKFKKYDFKPISHAEYHNSWMQTVESEIAVLINKPSEKAAQLATLYLPVNVKENVDGKEIKIRKFSTMMRIKFYENESGKPGREIHHGNIVFIINETHTKEVFELNLLNHVIFIPENGLYVSIQVLGPTDDNGNFIQTRTYNEFETRRGIERVAISFRPLLPLTNQIAGDKTYVRRVFLADKEWNYFNLNYNPESKLLVKGFNNYGMGARLHIYEEK